MSFPCEPNSGYCLTQSSAIIASEPKGLSMEVVTRLMSLKVIEESMTSSGDSAADLLNVRAIMKAYRKKKLGFQPGTFQLFLSLRLIY